MRAIMLTSSSNQYLRPEYLTPLPTTLDAKKSPLALLAQTCSQIGADPPSSSAKSSLLNANVAGAHHSSSSSEIMATSTPTNLKSKGNTSITTKTYHDPEKHRKTSSGSPTTTGSVNSINVNGLSTMPSSGVRNVFEDKVRSKTPGSKATTPSPPVGGGHASTNTNYPTGNPPNKSPLTTTTPVTSSTSTADSTLSSSSSSALSMSMSSLSAPSSTSSISPVANKSSSSSSAAQVVHLTESTSTSQKLRLNSPLNFGSSNSSVDLQLALKHGLPFPGLYPPVPVPSSTTAGTGIPPYLHSYARLKAAASAAAAAVASSSGSSVVSDSIMTSGGPPSCRDPFCGGCHLGQHGGLGLTKMTCPDGCTQCDHRKNPSASALFGSGFPFLPPGFPGLPPGFPGSYYSALSAGSNPSSMHQPYVCNWIVGDSYCGKRFSSSEELLQHLRIHTTTLACFGGSEAAAVHNLAAAAAAAGYNPPPHHPSLLTSSHGHHGHGHSLLSRTYPTPPLSPLSSARFHPYSKAGGGGHSSGLTAFGGPLSLSIPPTPPGFPSGFSGLGHPALSPYYPYSLYGQRLGAAAAAAGSLHP